MMAGLMVATMGEKRVVLMENYLVEKTELMMDNYWVEKKVAMKVAMKVG